MKKIKEFLRFTFTTTTGLSCLVDVLCHAVICAFVFYCFFKYIL